MKSLSNSNWFRTESILAVGYICPKQDRNTSKHVLRDNT